MRGKAMVWRPRVGSLPTGVSPGQSGIPRMKNDPDLSIPTGAAPPFATSGWVRARNLGDDSKFDGDFSLPLVSRRVPPI